MPTKIYLFPNIFLIFCKRQVATRKNILFSAILEDIFNQQTEICQLFFFFAVNYLINLWVAHTYILPPGATSIISNSITLKYTL